MKRAVSYRGSGVVQLAVRLALALGLALMVRSATIELNATLGVIWPFSLVHCDTASAPGCSPAEPAHRSLPVR